MASGQSVGRLRYDTTILEKVGGSNELKIKNNTRDSVGGIFTNVGGGWGRWLKPRTNFDTLFIGLDTVIVGSSPVNIYNADGILTGDRTLTGNNGLYSMLWDSMKLVNFNVWSTVAGDKGEVNLQNTLASLGWATDNLDRSAYLYADPFGAKLQAYDLSESKEINLLVDKDSIYTTYSQGAPNIASIGDDRIVTRSPTGGIRYLDASAIGGGSPNTSIGAGFKVAVNGTNNVKSLKGGSNVTLDSLVTGEVRINASGDTTIANVLDYGAIPNDGLSDDVAFKAAIATGKRVYVPAIGDYFINDTLFISDKQEIFGGGINSVLYTTEDSVNIIHLSDSSLVHDLAFRGTGVGTIPGGTFTLQNGIFYGGFGNTIHDCYFSDIKGSAIYSYAGSTITGNEVSRCVVVRSTVGVFLLINSEYGNYNDIRVYDGNVAFFERNSGNNKWNGLTAEFNDVGFRLLSNSGGNGGHGQVVASTFNHQTSYGIEVQSEERTYLFANNQIWNNGTGVAIGSVDTARRVVFSDNVISGGSIITTKASDCVWTGGTFGTSAVTVTGTTGIEYCHIMNSVYQTVGCGTSSGMTNPMTAVDDIIIGGSSGAPTRLPAGADGQFLQYTTAGGIDWASITGGGDVTKVGTPVNNQVGVWTGNGTIEGDPNFTWDASKLTVTGAAEVTGAATLPTIQGGTAVGSGVIIKSTIANGTTTGTAFTLTGGNNGATVLLRGTNDGMFAIGPNAPLTNTRLFITGSGSSSATYNAIFRNLNSDNLLIIDNAGSFTIGNNQNSASTHSINGTTTFGATNTALTNTVSYNTVYRHQTSGTAAAGLGVGSQYNLENASGTIVNMATKAYALTDATNASEDADEVTSLKVNGSLTERMRLRSSGALQVGGTPDVTTADSLLAIEGGDIKKVGTNTLFSSGTYTPTIAGTVNVTSSSVNGTFKYIRIGAIVQVSGQIALTQTSANTTTSFTLTLPVSSNFTQAYDATGHVTNSGQDRTAGVIYANSSASTVTFEWYPTGITNPMQYVSFQYEIK